MGIVRARDDSCNNAGTSIREAVCRILEGGKDAFRQREHRYGQALDA